MPDYLGYAIATLCAAVAAWFAQQTQTLKGKVNSIEKSVNGRHDDEPSMSTEVRNIMDFIKDPDFGLAALASKQRDLERIMTGHLEWHLSKKDPQ